MNFLKVSIFDRRIVTSNLLLILSCALSLAVVVLGLSHVSQLMFGCMGCGDAQRVFMGPFGAALAVFVLAVVLMAVAVFVRYPKHGE